MGFWHTGYMEFHEATGLYPPIGPYIPTYRCAHCPLEYRSADLLRKHRFEAHPLHRPVMFLRGREVGTRPVRVRGHLRISDLKFEHCKGARLNGAEIDLAGLTRKLASVRRDVCRIRLLNAGVTADFELDIRIPSEGDLAGVEQKLSRFSRAGVLNARTVEGFIQTCSAFKTAVSYCDALATYLHGVLAKERSPGISIRHDQYASRFSRAAEELAAYDRPLARIVGSIIEFHFNHFSEASRLGVSARIGQVAERFEGWTQRPGDRRSDHWHARTVTALDSLLTDADTEHIIEWGAMPLSTLSTHVQDMTHFMRRDMVAFDKVKVHVLLGEECIARRRVEEARVHAKAVRNVAGFEQWSESVLQMESRRSR